MKPLPRAIAKALKNTARDIYFFILNKLCNLIVDKQPYTDCAEDDFVSQ